MEYLNAKDIQNLTGMNYKYCLEFINEVRKEMQEKNYFVPKGKTKVALKRLVYKKLGIEE